MRAKQHPLFPASGNFHFRKKAAPKKEEFSFAIGRSQMGAVVVAVSDLGIVCVMIDDKAAHLAGRLQKHFPKIRLRKGGQEAEEALRRVVRYIEKPAPAHNLALEIRGTPFQQRVWFAVQKVPAGETSTYTDIARQIGAPRAVRAVGSTCTKNLFALVIPCHRVLHKGESANSSRQSRRKRAYLAWDKKIRNAE